jgi:hypothetical protein
MTPAAYAVIKNGEVIFPCATATEAQWFAEVGGGTVEPLYRGGAELAEVLESLMLNADRRLFSPGQLKRAQAALAKWRGES